MYVQPLHRTRRVLGDAKVHRDRLCHELHREHPQYGFASHKGYSTPEHLTALQRHGACVHHRRSFAPVRRALGLQLEIGLDGAVEVEVQVEVQVGAGREGGPEAAALPAGPAGR